MEEERKIMEDGQLETATTSRVCRNCGEPLIPGKKFCASCGTPVDASFTSPSQQGTSGSNYEKHKKSKVPLIIAIAGAVVVVAVILAIFLTRETPATALTFDETICSMPIGNQTTLEYTIEPEKASNNKLTWTSSDENVATVNKNGTITAINPGTCTISATTKNNITAVVSITVGAMVESVEFRDDEVSIKEEENTSLVVTVSPSNAYDKTLIWESSNSAVAEVKEDGTIVGVAEGTCVVTATTVNGLSASCTINVEPAGPDFLSLYVAYCDEPWATLADDGSYLELDSNPYDVDNDDFTATEYGYMKSVISALESIHSELGVPDSIEERMNSTTAMQGVQTAEYDTFTISWSYHPDNGLEIMYELK